MESLKQPRKSTFKHFFVNGMSVLQQSGISCPKLILVLVCMKTALLFCLSLNDMHHWFEKCTRTTKLSQSCVLATKKETNLCDMEHNHQKWQPHPWTSPHGNNTEVLRPSGSSSETSLPFLYVTGSSSRSWQRRMKQLFIHPEKKTIGNVTACLITLECTRIWNNTAVITAFHLCIQLAGGEMAPLHRCLGDGVKFKRADISGPGSNLNTTPPAEQGPKISGPDNVMAWSEFTRW